nr:GapR family DNA-binding domain-containing protein [Allosphingosinicella vermicomposti]
MQSCHVSSRGCFGYDTKTMRAIVRLRKMENHVRQEADALLETYRQALGLD